MNIKSILKPALICVEIVLLFGALSYAYAPWVLSGKVVNQSDTSGWMGMAHEALEYNETHPDDKTAWTGSMFSGMPTVTFCDEVGGDWTKPLYSGLMSVAARPVNFFFVSLVGALLMLLVFGVSWPLAVAGAIAVTFCSYNLQIIQVGHNTKMQAIALMPWVIAGIVFTYRSALVSLSGRPRVAAARTSGNAGTAAKVPSGGADNNAADAEAEAPSGWKSWLPKTMLGAVLFAVALSFQIKANHPQISYYLAIIILIYAIAVLISVCIDKEHQRVALGRFFTASALLAVIGLIGIATNSNKLLPTYRHTKYTMRGGSELSAGTSQTHSDKGLDLAYATAWSYGVNETPNLLIPNFNGGSSSSSELGRDSETYKLLQRAGQPGLNNIMKALPMYWGPQPFTAGPMYMGAITIFLFILGMCIWRGKERWWLLAATLVAVFLAWGNHFMWFTRLWFNHVPLYNKFRTVSMTLVILQVTLPILGFITLDRILKGGVERRRLLRGLGISTAITAGFCLICILIPGIAGSFTGSSDAGQPDILVEAFAADRRHLLVSDAWRSFSLIALSVILLYWLFGRKNSYSSNAKTGILSVTLCCLMLFDLWGVGKRYLNKDHFVSKRDFTGQFTPRAVDNLIKEDHDPSYRVLDISSNTFNESFTSYFHKSIGGYSPVKMQRYQDLIERYLSKEIGTMGRHVNSCATVSEVQESMPYLPVISMLNGRYIILGGEYAPVVNPYAFGNAWFVDEFTDAATPDEEISALGTTDLRTTAVIGADFRNAVAAFRGKTGDTAGGTAGGTVGDTAGDTIVLTSYAPNELHYHYRTTRDRAVIFSEIYYPDGWTLRYEPTGKTSGAKSVAGISVSVGEDSGGEIELFRADWILRGAILPAGEGDLVMRFDPQINKIAARISRASSITLLLLLLLSIAGYIRVSRPRKVSR